MNRFKKTFLALARAAWEERGVAAGPVIRLRDVARAAGVSQGTASNAFSRPELVRAELRDRVLATARDLGYAGPDRRGRLLRAGKVNAIGVATAEPLSYFFDDPWARALMTAISDACDERGAGVALVSAQNRQRLAWNIDSALVDGFILLCVERGEALLELTERRGLPFVPLALDFETPDVPALAIDDFGGAEAAAGHLLGLGHRRFAILALDLSDAGTGPVSPAAVRASAYSTSRNRALGYWAALAAAGIGEDAVPIFDTRNDRAAVDEAMTALFGGPGRPTALLAMSDRVAMAAVAWLAARGLGVPADVSVAGFDGVPEAEGAGLTTVAQPFGRIARRAVSAILDDDMPVAREVVPLALVARGSTGPAPG